MLRQVVALKCNTVRYLDGSVTESPTVQIYRMNTNVRIVLRTPCTAGEEGRVSQRGRDAMGRSTVQMGRMKRIAVSCYLLYLLFYLFLTYFFYSTVSIAPLVSQATNPLTPHRKQFFDEGFATFTEKGATGKLCAEGLSTDREQGIRETVAESLCKALGYDRHILAEVRSDTEPGISYVRVLDPRATEISFIRTECKTRAALYIKCAQQECGIQSIYGGSRVSLTKMSASGDWPWHVALFRSDVHACDGTLVAENWVLTTEGCFQGQSKATWLAILGTNRLESTPPWIQRRRIVSRFG